MFAFVDETGNTGANIFDASQPDFYTAAVVTRTDFDALYGNRWRELCAEHGVQSLHANRLGVRKIEEIAPSALKLLKNASPLFFLSRVEKRYLLATKVFDTFFDSGENPAVPWDAYNLRPLRIILCFKVASLIDDELARRFWDMLMARREQDARAMIPGICDAFLKRVSSLPDERSREIVADAFGWSRDHPEALDIFINRRQAKNNHMPNMVAFGNLLDGLENFSKRWNRRLRRLTHDRQSQFEKSLEEWHRVFANAAEGEVKWAGEAYSVRKVPGSDFAISASDFSPGIQAADLILWLFSQSLSGRDLPAHSARLLDFAFQNGWQSDFSFAGVEKSLIERFGPILSQPLTPEQEQKARDLRNQIEKRRQTAVEMYEKDGLMPYERSWASFEKPEIEN